ncbi:MAG: thermonuclease family protein [Erysipelotrichaceae bacterium]|nr:thermonuclease family protein [Erysipelotrichaceae bacterium]
MKKFIYILCLLFILLISSCTNVNNKRILPDLTGKSRTQIEEIMEDADIDYIFKFSDQIIESSLDLDIFVSYNGDYKAGDEIDANYQIYVYTTVLPITYEIHDEVKMDFEYVDKSFINDGIGEVELVYSIDGDTARFRDIITGEVFSLRFLGIDTPESTIDKDPWGKAASNYTKKKLESAKTIVLEAEGARTENYGRYLGFVWVDGVLLNLELVEQAYSNSTLNNSKYAEYFSLASSQAKKTGRRFFGETDPNYDYDRKEFK